MAAAGCVSASLQLWQLSLPITGQASNLSQRRPQIVCLPAAFNLRLRSSSLLVPAHRATILCSISKGLVPFSKFRYSSSTKDWSKHWGRRAVQSAAAIAGGEGDRDESESEREGAAPKTPNDVDRMRGELEALQAELNDTRTKAHAAGDRFLRLTDAVDKKRSAAEKAMRAGDEETARRLLQEKASVLQALEKSRERAEVLQALAAQLGKVISRKETLYIAALSSVKGAEDTAASDPPQRVTLVEPTKVPPPSLEREEAAAQEVASLVEESEGPEDLDSRFLDMERTTLERMYTQSPAANADRQSSGEPSTSSPSPEAALRSTADLYRQEVRRQIAEVELKLAVLESDRVERLEGRDPGGNRSATADGAETLDEKIGKAREVLARLRQVEWKIQDGAFETTYAQDSAGKRAPWPEIKVPEEQRAAVQQEVKTVAPPSKKVLRALEYIRQKDSVGAARLLQQLLSEESPEGWTWDSLAGEQGPPSITDGERADLYYAYLRHVLVPEAITEPAAPDSPASYLGAAASRVLEPSRPPPPHPHLQTLRSFLGVSPQASGFAHREAFGEVLTSAALENEDWALPGFDRLRAELALAGHVADELRGRAEAVGKYRRLVSMVLKDLREKKGGATGRSVDWKLTGEHRRELADWCGKLDLPPHLARSACSAACRGALQELLQGVLEVQRKKGGLAAPVAAELDNMVRFAREAAIPALEVVSGSERRLEDASEGAFGASGGVPGASEGAPESSIRSSGSSTGASTELVPTRSVRTPIGASSGSHVSVRDLRLLVFGGDAETLVSAYLENGCKQRVARVLSSDSDETEDAGEVAALQEEAAADLDVLAGLLGVSTPVVGALQRSAAASAYAELSKRAMTDAYVSSESRSQLDRARAVLGLSAAEAKRIEQVAAAVRIGAAAKKLLDKRARGRDVTSAEVRLLASMCENLQVVRVAQVDSRDAVVLYKRAAQTVLEEGSARSVNPGQLVLEGQALLQRLATAFGISDLDVRETLTSVMEGAAKSALVQARASLRREDPSLAADDVTRLAIILAYKPEADVSKAGLPESEGRELYSLFSSRHGRARDTGVVKTQLTLLQEEMLRRLAKYLGLL